MFGCFSDCAYFISNCCLLKVVIVINGVGWLDDSHGPSPILCNTVTFFSYIDQFFCHCVFIHSNFHWRLVTFLHDDFLCCFCLLTGSYETISSLRRAPHQLIPFAAGISISVYSRQGMMYLAENRQCLVAVCFSSGIIYCQTWSATSNPPSRTSGKNGNIRDMDEVIKQAKICCYFCLVNENECKRKIARLCYRKKKHATNCSHKETVSTSF